MNFIKPLMLLWLFSFPLSAFPQEENTLENQFDEFYRKSSNYQEYKVVKRTSLTDFKQNVLDSISVYKDVIAQMQSESESQEIEMRLLHTSLEETRQNLAASESRTNSISFLGISMTKLLYNSILWGIIALLGIALFLFVYKFNKSNKITKDAVSKLEETEEEFLNFKQRAMEREQQLNRKLLDEIKKHK